MVLLHDFFHLFYPHLCEACSSALYQGEELICIRCLSKLPYTHYEKTPENKMSKIFWGRIHLEKATSFLFFTKGSRVQVLMHALKYRKRPDIGVYLGQLFYQELKNTGWLNDVDLIVPVPLHPQKEKKRGYNQAAVFAHGLAKASAVPCLDHGLKRKKFTESQTRKTRINRWENVEEVFETAMEEQLANKHILLIDDIITTGATLEACAAVLQKIPGTRVSVATIACTF